MQKWVIWFIKVAIGNIFNKFQYVFCMFMIETIDLDKAAQTNAQQLWFWVFPDFEVDSDIDKLVGEKEGQCLWTLDSYRAYLKSSFFVHCETLNPFFFFEEEEWDLDIIRSNQKES